jgi:hypothetical protein
MTLRQLITEEYWTETKHILRAKAQKAFASNNVTKHLVYTVDLSIYRGRAGRHHASYSRGTAFKSRPRHRLSWLKISLIFPSPYRQMARYYLNFFFRGVGWDWVQLVCRPLIGLLYQPRMIDEHGAFGGMRIGRGSRNTRRKPAQFLLCCTINPTWLDPGSNPGHRGVENRRLIAWSTAQPNQLTLRYKRFDPHSFQHIIGGSDDHSMLCSLSYSWRR